MRNGAGVRPSLPRDPVIRGIKAVIDDHAADQRMIGHTNARVGDDHDRQVQAKGDPVNLVLDRTGIGIDQDARGRHRLSAGLAAKRLAASGASPRFAAKGARRGRAARGITIGALTLGRRTAAGAVTRAVTGAKCTRWRRAARIVASIVPRRFAWAAHHRFNHDAVFGVIPSSAT